MTTKRKAPAAPPSKAPKTAPKPPGRPPGSGKKQKSVEHALRIIKDGPLRSVVYGKLHPNATPLDVMVEAMREAYEIGGAIAAAPFAEKAAPYIHPRIANIEVAPPPGLPSPGEATQQAGLGKFYVDFVDVEAREVPEDEVNGNPSTDEQP